MEANLEQYGSESRAEWKRIWSGIEANLERDGSESGTGWKRTWRRMNEITQIWEGVW